MPVRVAAIVRKLMAKRPEDRYQTPAELIEDLSVEALTQWRAGSVSDRRRPTPVADAPGSPENKSLFVGTSGQIPGSPPASARRARRRSKVWIAIAAAVFLFVPLLIGLAVYLFRDDNRPAPVENIRDTPSVPSGREITNSLKMKLVRIPAGQFFIGSPPNEPHRRSDESPSHQVTIGQPFYLGAHLVTVGDFRAFVADTGHQTEAEQDGDKRLVRSWRRPGWEQDDSYPVACLSWYDARDFCDWLSKKEKRTYRLPTEAEWEYACRAGSTSAYCFGSDPKKLARTPGSAATPAQSAPGRQAQGQRLGPVRHARQFAPVVRRLLPGEVLRAGGPRRPGRTQARLPSRVLRGGSWNSAPAECRSAQRTADSPTAHRNDRGGFRVVLVPPE